MFQYIEAHPVWTLVYLCIIALLIDKVVCETLNTIRLKK
jgi:hypothetical protein